MKSLAIALTLTLAVSGSHASAGRLEDKLTASAPCKDLPQINQTEAVSLERATVTILPETAELSVIGRISCRSPSDALFQSDASVRVQADVALNIADCTATRSDVRLSEFEGNVGGLVEAVSQALEEDLSADLADAVEDECRDNFD